MFTDLLRQERVWDELDEVVDGVDRRVDGFEPLDLLTDGKRVIATATDRGHAPSGPAPAAVVHVVYGGPEINQ